MDAPAQLVPEDAAEASPIPTLLRRCFPFYCVLAALITFGYALYDRYQIDGDAVAYMDIADCLRAHQWPGIVNGYWHPMYPAFLAAGHALFHATPANELHAYYMANFAIFLLGMLAVVCFTDALVRLRATLQARTRNNGLASSANTRSVTSASRSSSSRASASCRWARSVPMRCCKPFYSSP